MPFSVAATAALVAVALACVARAEDAAPFSPGSGKFTLVAGPKTCPMYLLVAKWHMDTSSTTGTEYSSTFESVLRPLDICTGGIMTANSNEGGPGAASDDIDEGLRIISEIRQTDKGRTGRGQHVNFATHANVHANAACDAAASEETMALFLDTSVIREMDPARLDAQLNVGMLQEMLASDTKQMLLYGDVALSPDELRGCIFVDGSSPTAMPDLTSQILFPGSSTDSPAPPLGKIVAVLADATHLAQGTENGKHLEHTSRSGDDFKTAGNSSIGAERTKNGNIPAEKELENFIMQCFPASATVKLEEGSTKAMSNLAIGDRVYVGNNQFSPVFMFSHKISFVQAVFVTLSTTNHSVSLSQGHYIYANGNMVAASEVQEGDMLHIGDLTTGEKVIKKSYERKSGLYNPQTVTGSIAVNGIITSCYTSAFEPRAAHGALAPLRALFQSTGLWVRAFENTSSFLARMAPKGSL